MSGKNEGEWFSEKWTSKTRAPKHPHFLIAKQQDSCDKTAGNGGQNMPMLQGSKIDRSLPGKPFTFDSHQPLSPHKQQTQARQSYRLNPKVTPGSRRSAPQLPAAPHSPPRRQAQSAEAAAGIRARNGHVPSHQPSGPNQQRPHRRPLAAASPPDRSHYSQSSLAIWTALVAAPLRIWSPQHQKVMPRAASGFEMSRRTRPTQIRS